MHMPDDSKYSINYNDVIYKMFVKYMQEISIVLYNDTYLLYQVYIYIDLNSSIINYFKNNGNIFFHKIM